MGSYCSVMNNTSGTMYCKYGADMTALEIMFDIIGDVGSCIPEIGEAIELIAEVGSTVIAIINLANEAEIQAMSGNLDQWFKNHSYGARSPNTAYVSEKVSLSLVMSAYCGLVTYVGNGQIQVQVGTMTCWSGPANNDTNHYNVTDCSWQQLSNQSSVAGVVASAANAAAISQAISVIQSAGGKTATATATSGGTAAPAVSSGANLAANKQLISEIQARVNAVGKNYNEKPGVAPGH